MRAWLTFGVKSSLLGVSTSLLPVKVSFLRSPNKRDFVSATYAHKALITSDLRSFEA